MTTSVLIMAGGTGGHVFPALAVARLLAVRQVRLSWLGTRRGLEARVVPASGLPIRMEWLTIRGLRRHGLVAWLTRTPLVVHEQNAIPGFTNRLLAPLADHVLSGFPGAFGELSVARHVGNPVRADIAALPTPEIRFAGHRGRLKLLVVGGSQGAAGFNEVGAAAVRVRRCSTKWCRRRSLRWRQSCARKSGISADTGTRDVSRPAIVWHMRTHA